MESNDPENENISSGIFRKMTSAGPNKLSVVSPNKIIKTLNSEEKLNMFIKDKNSFTNSITEFKSDSKFEKSPQNLDENFSREDGMIKGFLLNLINNEEIDDFVNMNSNKSKKIEKNETYLKNFNKKRRFGMTNDNNGELENISIINRSKSKFLNEVSEMGLKDDLDNLNSQSRRSLDLNFRKNNINNVISGEKSEFAKHQSLFYKNLKIEKYSQEDISINEENCLLTEDKYYSPVFTENLYKNENNLLVQNDLTFENKINTREEFILNNMDTNFKLLPIISSYDKEKLEIEKVFPREIQNNNLNNHRKNNFNEKIKFNNFFKFKEDITNTNKEKLIQLEKEKRILESFKNVYDSFSDSEGKEDEILIINEKSEETFLIIHPESNFKAFWDHIILISIVYCLFVYPFRISFRRRFTNLDIYFYIDLLIDISFLLDFIFIFFTPFYNKYENLIFDRKLIIKNYLIQYGVVIKDLLSSIPVSIFSIMNLGFIVNILVFLRFVRILKLFSNIKRKIIISHKNNFYRFLFSNSHNSRTFRYMFFFSVIIHISACIWIYIGLMEDSEIEYLNPSALPEFRDTWVQRYRIQFQETESVRITDFDLYITSLYFTLTTIYTIGYGDIFSRNFIERIYNNIFMMVGVILYSFAVSSLSTNFSNYDKAQKRYFKKIKVLRDIKKDFKLPDNIFKIINKNLKYNYDQNHSQYYNEKYKFLKSLPKYVKNEITISIYKKNLKNIHFFQEKYMNMDYDFILSTLPYIVSCKMLKNEIIFTQGDIVDECYIVRKGCLNIFVNESHVPIEIAQIPQNYNFGEILMYSNETSPFNLKVSSNYVELMVIKKEKFTKLKIKYPHILSNILDDGWKFYCFLLNRRDFILENVGKFDLKILKDPYEIKKEIRKLKNEFNDGNGNFDMKNWIEFSVDNNYNIYNPNNNNEKIYESRFSSSKNVIMNFKIDTQMENIEKNIDEELHLIKNIKLVKKSSMSLKGYEELEFSKKHNSKNYREKTENSGTDLSPISVGDSVKKHNLMNSINYKYSKFKSKDNLNKLNNLKNETNNNTKNIENNKIIYNTKKSVIKLNNLKSTNNTTQKMKQINFINIENNINEHFIMMDQNREINKIEITKNKLIDLISQNKSLKKKLVKQEPAIINKLTQKSLFKIDLSSNFYKDSELNLIKKNVDSIDKLYKKLKYNIKCKKM